METTQATTNNNYTVNVTVTAHSFEELAASLENAARGVRASYTSTGAATSSETAAPRKAKAAKAAPVVEDESWDEEVEEKTYTVAEVRAALTKWVNSGKGTNAEVKAMVKDYGVKTVDAVNPKYFGEIMAKVC